MAGIIIMAIADGLADAAGLHMAEEAEVEKGILKHTQKKIWLTTFLTFFCVSISTLTFAIPFLIFSIKTALFLAIGWGMSLLILSNLYIAKITKENPIKLIFEHILLAISVIIVSYLVGNLIAMWVRW